MSGLAGNIAWFVGAVALGVVACSSGGGGSKSALADDGPNGAAGAEAADAAAGGEEPRTGAGGDRLLDPGEATARGGAGGAVCGSVSLDAKVEQVVVPGNLLIVYDQSLSMNDDWNGQPRWRAASDAVVAAISKVQDHLTVGAVFFPSIPTLAVIRGLPCDDGSVVEIDDTKSDNPQIPFTSGQDFLHEWAEHWESNPLRLGTPTQAGLERARDALASAKLSGPTAMVLVTDGEPTCGTASEERELVADAAARGTKTYVIGLPGSRSAASLLDALAAAGGTGHFLDTSQRAELEKALTDVTSTVVKRSLDSCSVELGSAPADPEKVVLVVTDGTSGQRLRVNPGPDGWALGPDGRRATLEGATCADALDGRFSNVSFELGCVDAPVLR